ncbi:uncharacterized protein LOC101924899 isoform X1 [Falco peregrinus]|uniref:uncharacterized protein LOC101924899 isoform X1 n=2 Tax=Falco peregrinus TaxID=8954 RepID=UPI0024785952|nr:uncharacterized protein LOC101924899 isoform X1 [Falco peregrinus]XP_055654137.1 uncharacterized protein LOC101924899 isoform X1 [Falco peregrinus]
MEDRRKKRSPKACLAPPLPAGAPRPLPHSKSTSFALPLPTLPSPRQRTRLRRTSKERARAGTGVSRGAPLQHSFLTDVSDVCEMEGGLLSLLSDFHSGKLQAFGKECSFEQLEHVREMQEKLARLHFGLDVCVEELPEEQKKVAADRNLDQLLAHLEELSSSISCTWPRARTPRTRPPDPAPGPAVGRPRAAAPKGPHSGADPAEGPPGPPPVKRGERSAPGPASAPRCHLGGPHGRGNGGEGAGLRLPSRPADVITSRRVAGAAMAAVLGPQAEAEGWRRLLRAVTRLQACVRGYLLRKRFRNLRAEYEEVVREIEGDLSQLRWRGRLLPRPLFVPEIPTQGKHAAPQEAVPSDEAGTEKAQELDASEPERDWGCSSVNPTAQLQSKKELSSMGEGDGVSPPDFGADATKCTEKVCIPPAENEDWQNGSDISSVWDDAVLGAESLEGCLEIPLEDIKELPRTRSGLQSYRNHLIMELLWLQQAIVSRKNYLMLKQRLGVPGP